MIKVVGIDPGLANTGYGSLEFRNGTPCVGLAGVIQTKPEDGNDTARTDQIRVHLSKLLRDYRPDCVGVEGWSYMGGRGKQESQMPALIENIRLLCMELGIPVLVYENAEWKKKTLGARTASKDHVKHYVGRKVPDAQQILAKKPNHVWDSIGICLAVLKDIPT